MKDHKVHVEQGPEYPGETYIWCECQMDQEEVFSPQSFRTVPPSLFEGNSPRELMTFLADHGYGLLVEQNYEEE